MYDYYLGIDGGGTKTEFALSDAHGKILNRTVLGPSNPNDVGIDTACSVLTDGIKALCKDLPKEKISVFAGLAGISSADYRPKIKEHLLSMGFGRAECGVDAQNAVASSLGRRNGIAVIMGTGAIAFTQREGELFRTGGFGYLFGDMGSGFSIGKDAVLAALKDESGYGEKTLITELVRAKCGHEKILDAIADFYRGGKKYIAEFAPLAFEALDLGDKVAEGIIKDNMQGIAELILGASQYSEDENIDVCLCGGVTKRQDTVLPLIKEALGSRAEKYNISVCNKPQVCGALALAGMEEE